MRILIPSKSQENSDSAGVQLAGSRASSALPELMALPCPAWCLALLSLSCIELNCCIGQDMFGQACDCLPDIHQPCLHLSL